MSGIEYSPEQKEYLTVADRESGIFLNQANAGSGKTEVSSELFVRIYVNEEERMFPKVKEKRLQGVTMHVKGKDQLAILKQFIVITFTVKAAEELNTRINAKLIARGIPVPEMPWGGPVKICSTIDSLLQKWFKNRTFFRAWSDWEFEEGKKDKELERKTPRLTVSHYFLFKELKEQHGEDIFPSQFEFFKAWPTLLIGDLQEAILGSMLRKQFKMELKGIEDPNNWRDLIREGISKVTINEHKRLDVPFFDELLGTLTKRKRFQDGARARVAKVLSGDGNMEDQRYADMFKPLIDLWDRVELAMGEFSMIYGIAKTRGYHPFLNPDNLNNPEILSVIAQSQSVNSIMMFHSLSKKYARAKQVLGVMDFSDYMETFLNVARGRREILDLNREYPRYGIRAKNMIIDETQDNAPCQYEIMRVLMPVRGVPFRSVPVGDAKQSIYAFRGASPRHFITAVQRYKKTHPNNVFSLSCSFRSCRRIVDLGNEIVTTLPSYRDTVIKSSTIYDEDGEVEISPPLRNQDHEMKYVLKEIELIQHRDKGASIMVLVRSGLFSHPLYNTLEKIEPPMATMLTMHRSKGLEADYVFVLGMTSGDFPDVRGDWDQEVNLLYVAATRARRKVYFTVPVNTTVRLDDGSVEFRDSGPSPFLRMVKSLEKNALERGWDIGMLIEGHLYHEKEKDRFQATMRSKMDDLKGVAEVNFPAPTYKELEDEPLESPESAPDSSTSNFMRRKRKAPPKGVLLPDGSIGVKTVESSWSADGDTRLYKKLKGAFTKNMQVPKLKGDELSRAMTLDFVTHNGTGKYAFTGKFMGSLS